MRVLHLLDPSERGVSAYALRALADAIRNLDFEQHTLVIGHREQVKLARGCGVRPIGSLPAPVGWPMMGLRGLRRIVDRWREDGRAFELLHVWGDGPATMAAIAAPGLQRVVSLLAPPRSRGFNSHVGVRRAFALLAASESIRESWVGAGAGRHRFEVAPPAARILASERETRAALRMRWTIADDTLTIGVISDHPAAASARLACEAAALAHGAGRVVRIVIDPAASDARTSRRWLHDLDLAHLVTFDPAMREPWRLIDGFDALLTNEHPPPLMASLAESAGRALLRTASRQELAREVIALSDGAIRGQTRSGDLLAGDVATFHDRLRNTYAAAHERRELLAARPRPRADAAAPASASTLTS